MSKISTDNNFDEIISNKLVLIDFYASWCNPCMSLKPQIEDIEEVYFHNVEENPTTPWKFRIMSIPTILVFKEGKLVDKVLPKSKQDVLDIIEKNK